MAEPEEAFPDRNDRETLKTGTGDMITGACIVLAAYVAGTLTVIALMRWAFFQEAGRRLTGQ